MAVFSQMVSVMLYAAFFQNLVLTSGYGLSESIRMAKRPKHLFMYSISILFFSVSASVICHFADSIELIRSLPEAAHFLVYCASVCLLYLICAAFFVYALGADKKFLNSLAMSALNTLVLAVPLINSRAGYTLARSVAAAVGAAAAFVLASLLVNAGIRHVAKNAAIPPAFRGTPAILIYIAMLSLAFSCFTGEFLFI